MSAVSEAALIARINRKLAHDGQRLCRTRQGSRDESNVGEFYIVDDRNIVVASYCELEGLGREIGALREQEAAA